MTVVISASIILAQIQVLKSVQLRLDWHCNLLVLLLELDCICFFLAFVLMLLDLLDVLAVFELVVNQVLSLGKVTNELFAFLPAQASKLCLLNDRCKFQLLLFLL